MVLRASGQAINASFLVDAIVDPSQESGVPSGAELLQFADAVLGIETTDHAAYCSHLSEAQEALANALGESAVAGAALVIGAFTKNDRIANGIGIPMDGPFLEQSVDFRDRLGLVDFPSAKNTLGADD